MGFNALHDMQKNIILTFRLSIQIDDLVYFTFSDAMKIFKNINEMTGLITNYLYTENIQHNPSLSMNNRKMY